MCCHRIRLPEDHTSTSMIPVPPTSRPQGIRLFVLPAISLLCVLLAPLSGAAQISISPTILFVHEDQPHSRLTLRNTGASAQEVTITSRFGYPESDENGVLTMNYDNHKMEARHGLNEHLRIFPRRFVLQPGEFQRVRVQVSPMDARAEGLYWTRLNITSSEIVPDIDTPVVEEGIGTRISYRIRQNIGIFFHRGEVRTALILDDLQVQRDGEALFLEMRLSSGGNSPFLGSMRARLLDGSGNEAASGEWLFSVFGERYWPQRLAVNDLPPGRYRIDLEFNARRSDVAPGDLPGADRVNESLFIEL